MPSVSPVIIDSLQRRVERLARRMAIEIGRAIPLAEGDSGGSTFGSEVLAACREGLRTLLALWAEERPPSAAELHRLAGMGGRLGTTGMPLDAILRAYRVAALVIWQHVIEMVRLHPEIEPQSVLTAVGPLFDYLDAISVAVSTSYLQTRERLHREQDRRHDQFFAVILGGTGDPALLAQAAADDGTVLEFPYRVVAVDAADTSAEATVATAWRTQRVHVTLYQATVVGLAPVGVRVETLARLLRHAASGAADPWPLAVGPVAHHLGELPAAVRAARDTLTVGRVLMPEATTLSAAELHVYRAWLHDLPGLREFVDAAIGPLLVHDRRRRLPLRQTLETLLIHEGPTAAARALGIHRHTLLYRMERIRELVGGWDDLEPRLRLLLALRGARLLEAVEVPAPTGLAGDDRP